VRFCKRKRQSPSRAAEFVIAGLTNARALFDANVGPKTSSTRIKVCTPTSGFAVVLTVFMVLDYTVAMESDAGKVPRTRKILFRM